MRHVRWYATLLAGILITVLSLTGCGPKPPLLIGFLGGLSNQGSSFSEEGRNGAILGIEQRNLAGGIGGRRIELIVENYSEGAGKVPAAFQALVDAGVVAIVGPYSSSAAIELEPFAEGAGIPLLSPISKANASAPEDGHVLRFGRPRRVEAQAVAGMLHARGIQRMALAIDMRNAAYSSSWSAEFRKAFKVMGAASAIEVPYGVHGEPSFSGIARELLSSRPDGVLFVSSAADAGRLAQQVAKLAPGLPMTASGWAVNEALLELGGQAVDGMVLVQPYNAGDTSPRYRAFQEAYTERFGRPPAYSAMISFDAVTVLAEALDRRKPEESPRDAILRNGPYQGLQETIWFNHTGAPPRKAWFSVVRNGRFEPLP